MTQDQQYQSLFQKEEECLCWIQDVLQQDGFEDQVVRWNSSILCRKEDVWCRVRSTKNDARFLSPNQTPTLEIAITFWRGNEHDRNNIQGNFTRHILTLEP